VGLKSLRVYLDSCIVIYLIEEHPLFSARIEKQLNQGFDIEIFVSVLTEMECLVFPLRNRNGLLIEKFNDWFDAVNLLPVSRTAFLNASQLRADFPSLKSPDALHLATATLYNCDEFWTNDERLKKYSSGDGKKHPLNDRIL
jgi:predicted nucleic acid-binding protein